VADRLDITGARWGLEGAEAILKLRALRSNKDFHAYWHGSTTWPKNAAESTSPDTPIASSRKRPDVHPREPHPIGFALTTPSSGVRCTALQQLASVSYSALVGRAFAPSPPTPESCPTLGSARVIEIGGATPSQLKLVRESLFENCCRQCGPHGRPEWRSTGARATTSSCL
jgi:hypothetical protein